MFSKLIVILSMVRKAIVVLAMLFFFFYRPAFAQCASASEFYRTITDPTLNRMALANLPDTLLKIEQQLVACHFENDSLHTIVLRKIGWAYFDLKNFSAATRYFKQSAAIISQHINSAAIVPSDLISAYYYLSGFCDSLGNGQAARQYADSCIAAGFRLHLQADYFFLSALVKRQIYFYNLGEYRLCADDAVLCEKYAGEYQKNATTKEERLTGLYIQQSSFGWNINALANLNEFAEAETILHQKIIEYRKAGLLNYLAFAYSKMAELEERRGNYRNAVSYAMQSFRLYRQTGNFFNCKQLLNELGNNIYFRHFRQYDSALYCYRTALSIQNIDKSLELKVPVEDMGICNNIANVYVEKKQFDSAFVYFDIAFGKIQPGLSEKTILQYKNLSEFAHQYKMDYLVHLLIDKGDAYKRQFEATAKPGSLANAIQTYQVADKLLERFIKAQFETASRLYWRKDSRQLYENAIRACWLANDPEKAFYFFERSRAVLLAIQLAEQNWLDNDAITSLATIKSKLVYFQGIRKGAIENSITYKQYADSILTYSQAMYYKQEGIRQQHKRYYQYNDTTMASVNDVRKYLLNDHQALVEIFSGAADEYILMITPGGMRVKRIDKTTCDQLTGKFITYITNRNLLNSDFNGFKTLSAKLHALLFQGMNLPDGRIIISPDGAYFPFESLVTANNAASPVYFLEKHMVSYTYSAQYLFNNFTTAGTKVAGNFFGVAPIRYRSNPDLPDLTGSDASLKKIGLRMTDPVYLTGNNASRNNFMRQYFQYTTIQLYTHAADSSNRSEPVLYFNDSALYLSELVPGIKPATQLVVLSACETGNGTMYQGEGVFSFNRAFAAMGVRSSVTNLWSIDNLATYRLTEFFYEYLAQGLALDVALQRAKLAFIKNTPGGGGLPYYWAAPILVGKTNPVPVNKAFAWQYLLAGMVAVAGLVFFAWRKWKR